MLTDEEIENFSYKVVIAATGDVEYPPSFTFPAVHIRLKELLAEQERQTRIETMSWARETCPHQPMPTTHILQRQECIQCWNDLIGKRAEKEVVEHGRDGELPSG